MLRPGRQAHIAQFRQQLADRALVHRDAEQDLDLLLEIDAPPAHDTILVRIGAGLDKPGDLRLLLRAEPRLAAFRLAVGQTCDPLGVVAVHPVPQGLPVHATSLGRVCSVRPFQHQRNRQNPPRCSRILQPRALAAKLGRHHVQTRDRDTHPKLLSIGDRKESQSEPLRNP